MLSNKEFPYLEEYTNLQLDFLRKNNKFRSPKQISVDPSLQIKGIIKERFYIDVLLKGIILFKIPPRCSISISVTPTRTKEKIYYREFLN